MPDPITKEPIPANIYFGMDGGNFYNATTHHGCGWMFYRKWRDRRSEFPQGCPVAGENPVTPKPQQATTREWYVDHDGPSRPITHSPGGSMYSISQFDDGRWVPYPAEDDHCKLFCQMANNELRAPKPGMMVIACDNFDRDDVSDELIAENVPIFYAEKLVAFLNEKYSGDNAQRFYKAVLPDYKLHRFTP